MVNVDTAHLKKMDFDPISGIIEVMQKLEYVDSKIAPSLKKERDLIMVQKFK